jgi:mono/diheme cytochrome c family protein
MTQALFVCAVMLVAVALACGRGGDRSSATADSVVLHASGASGKVYTAGDSATGGDTSMAADTASEEPAIVFPYPATIFAGDSVAGQRLYRTSGGCIACHGTRGEGVAGLGSSLADTVWSRGFGSLSLLFSVIRDGVTGGRDPRATMPGLEGRVSQRELFQIAAYVYTLSHHGVTVRDTSTLAVDRPPLARPPADTSGGVR